MLLGIVEFTNFLLFINSGTDVPYERQPELFHQDEMDEKEGGAKGKGPECDTVDGSAGHEHDGDDE